MSNDVHVNKSTVKDGSHLSYVTLLAIAFGIIVMTLVLLAWGVAKLRYDPQLQRFVQVTSAFFYIVALTGILAALLYYRFFPHLVVTINIDEPTSRVLRLRLQVENKSNVAVIKESAKLQILEHQVSAQTNWLLSADYRIPNPRVRSAKTTAPTEWVPLNEMALARANRGEEPVGGQLKEPINVMSSTIGLEPNQIATTDLLYALSPDATAVHCALQIRVSINKIALWICRRTMGPDYYPQATATAWALVAPARPFGDATGSRPAQEFEAPRNA